MSKTIYGPALIAKIVFNCRQLRPMNFEFSFGAGQGNATLRNKIAAIGHFSGQLGIGEASRRLLSLLDYVGYEIHTANFRLDRSASVPSKQWKRMSRRSEYDTLITCVNADLTGLAYVNAYLRLGNLQALRHVGFWSWELENFPSAFDPAVNVVDEIWTVSEFAKRSIQKRSIARNVKALDLPLPENRLAKLNAFKRSTSRSMTVLVTYDASSGEHRKSPSSAVRAYLAAFSELDGCNLVVKVANARRLDQELRLIEKIVSHRTDVTIIAKNLSPIAYSNLIDSTDVILSLHRSEGLGLNLIDAMSLGKVVVATGYSGNMEYMNDTNSVPIKYELTPISMYANVPVNSFWATPSVEHAAAELRSLRNNPNLRDEIGIQAMNYINLRYSLKKTGEDFITKIRDSDWTH